MPQPERTSSAACPYCGEPKDRHTYATPTSCVIGGFPPRRIESAAKGYVYDRFVVPGEHDGRDEASVKVLGREIVNGAADESEIVARVRVKVVDARVVVTIERVDDGLEVLVRWP